MVLAILGILAAVVSIAVVGLVGRGEDEAYATDERTIQLAVSTFYSDTHAYAGDGGNGWNETGGYTSVHNYPTASGLASNLYAADTTTELNGYDVWEVQGFTGSTHAERRAEVIDAAIWMSLLSKGHGEGSPGPDIAPGDENSPLQDEHGPYLNPLPESCSVRNHSEGLGSITWIVGNYGRIYGIYEVDGVWYTGYGGRYP